MSVSGGQAVAGRGCPLAYRYRPDDLAGPPAFEAATLYVVGGLYGNTRALTAILERAAAEPAAPQIVFNGDFHYLDADSSAFRGIADGVLRYRATLGNVEYALNPDHDDVGCGCDYPDYVSDAVVADSNAVVARLREAAAEYPEHLDWLAGLPRYLTVSVDESRVAIVHGDLESLAGWKLALEAVEPADLIARENTGWSGAPTSLDEIGSWFDQANVEVICATHTGLPYAQDYRGRHLVANNGCAGLPNFAGHRHGVISRLSTDPATPADSLYGIQLGGLRFDALPVRYDTDEWAAHFLSIWPAGTPGHRGYYRRITDSTWMRMEQAARGDVRLTAR